MTPEQKKLARIAVAMLYVNLRDNVTITFGQLQDVLTIAELKEKEQPFGPDLEDRLKDLLEVLK